MDARNGAGAARCGSRMIKRLASQSCTFNAYSYGTPQGCLAAMTHNHCDTPHGRHVTDVDVDNHIDNGSVPRQAFDSVHSFLPSTPDHDHDRKLGQGRLLPAFALNSSAECVPLVTKGSLLPAWPLSGNPSPRIAQARADYDLFCPRTGASFRATLGSAVAKLWTRLLQV